MFFGNGQQLFGWTPHIRVTPEKMVRVAGVEPAWTCAQDMWVAATLHRTLVARHGIEPYPLAFQTSTLPSSSRAKLWWTVRELNSHFERLQAVSNPVIRTAHLGRDERIELSCDWIHNPAPKPFGQSRHKTWSWSSESNTRRRGYKLSALPLC